jgi:hypothetical protein
MDDNQTDSQDKTEPKLSPELRDSILTELKPFFSNRLGLDHFSDAVIDNDFRSAESFRDFIDSWGRFFEKIIIVDGMIFASSLTLLGFIINFSPEHHIPFRNGIYVLIAWIFLLVSFCTSGIQVKHVVEQKSRRFVREFQGKLLPDVAKIVRNVHGILNTLQRFPGLGDDAKNAIASFSEKPGIKAALSDEKLRDLRTKLAFPQYPPVKLAILGWGPPLLSMVLIVVFVAVSIFQW